MAAEAKDVSASVVERVQSALHEHTPLPHDIQNLVLAFVMFDYSILSGLWLYGTGNPKDQSSGWLQFSYDNGWQMELTVTDAKMWAQWAEGTLMPPKEDSPWSNCLPLQARLDLCAGGNVHEGGGQAGDADISVTSSPEHGLRLALDNIVLLRSDWYFQHAVDSDARGPLIFRKASNAEESMDWPEFEW